MARYSGFTNSKSLNARQAEAEGRFTPSIWVKRLTKKGLLRGVTAADLKTALGGKRDGREWHHVGSYAAEVPYYSLFEIFEARREIRAAIAARKSTVNAVTYPRVLHEVAAVEIVEWEGAGRHKRPVTYTTESARVIQISPTMAEISGPFRRLKSDAGTLTFRKKLDGNHIKITSV